MSLQIATYVTITVNCSVLLGFKTHLVQCYRGAGIDGVIGSSYTDRLRGHGWGVLTAVLMDMQGC